MRHDFSFRAAGPSRRGVVIRGTAVARFTLGVRVSPAARISIIVLVGFVSFISGVRARNQGPVQGATRERGPSMQVASDPVSSLTGDNAQSGETDDSAGVEY